MVRPDILHLLELRLANLKLPPTSKILGPALKVHEEVKVRFLHLAVFVGGDGMFVANDGVVLEKLPCCMDRLKQQRNSNQTALRIPDEW